MRQVGVCCAVLGDCAYTYGGRWKYGYAVHELNLETMVWRRLEPKNREDGPLTDKHEAGMVACGDEALCVFGGYGPDTGRHAHQRGATYHSDSVITLKTAGPMNYMHRKNALSTRTKTEIRDN